MRFLLALLLLVLAAQAAETGPWNLAALKQPPRAEWGERTGLVQEVFYEGEPFGGKTTRIFAYLARPEGGGPFPAMVLVHGGGGQAFKDWAEHWAKRGYVALAMDLSGRGKDKQRLPDGGPEQSDQFKFRPFTDADVGETWTYHTVAAVIRGHSLLASLPEVEAARIGITGISWGGYLTCIVAGLDDRLKVAVPVYGCGFLGDNSFWKEPILDKMPPELRARWLKNLDPSSYLANVRCPILFLNGTNDFAYPLDSMKKSYELVDEKLRNISIIVEMKHGHFWRFPEVDAFVDAELRGGEKLPRFISTFVEGRMIRAQAEGSEKYSARLNFTIDSGPWDKRTWFTVSTWEHYSITTAELPASKEVTFFLSARNRQGVKASTPYSTLATESSPPRAEVPPQARAKSMIVQLCDISANCGIPANKTKGLVAALWSDRDSETKSIAQRWLEKNLESISGTAAYEGHQPSWGGRLTVKAAEKSERLDGEPEAPKPGKPRTIYAHVFTAPENGEIALQLPAERIAICRLLSVADQHLAFRRDGEYRTVVTLPKNLDPIDTVIEIQLAP